MTWEPSPLIVDGTREWVQWVAALPADWTTDGERLVMTMLACDAYVNESAPGIDNVAAWTGMNRRSVQRTLLGLLSPNANRPALLVKTNISKGKAASRYRFQPPPTADVESHPNLRTTSAQPPPTADVEPPHNLRTTSAVSGPPSPSPEIPSLSAEARAVANALGLQDDDERLTSVDQMLKDNSAKKPLAFIAHCAKNGSLTDLLTEAHGGTWAKQFKAAEADRRRCPHGVINGKSAGQCVKCTEDVFAMPA
jgi:hypothetical protein